MRNWIIRVIRNIYKGTAASVVLGAVGGLLGLIAGKDPLKGATAAILAGGTLMMVFSAAQLIGSPGKRIAFFFGGLAHRDGMQPLTDGQKKERAFNDSGFSEALIGVTMVILGFLVDALGHL
ncbi:MAG: hypothetical protein AVO33_01770 [delta proteobacterium ML8_F1]|nr:MAG: hypothetical protein AVO33_01770 [delta proteobacterium ML8_F1]